MGMCLAPKLPCSTGSTNGQVDGGLAPAAAACNDKPRAGSCKVTCVAKGRPAGAASLAAAHHDYNSTALLLAIGWSVHQVTRPPLH